MVLTFTGTKLISLQIQIHFENRVHADHINHTTDLLHVVETNFRARLVERRLSALEAPRGRVALLVTEAAELAAPRTRTAPPSPPLWWWSDNK
jgi:hypothetical protein